MKPWLSVIIPALGLVSVLAYLAWGTIGRDRGQQESPALAAAPDVSPDVPQGAPLIVVSISPEARVKASAGDATPTLTQGAWTEFPIEIQNAALMTSPIVVESAQAMVDDGDLSRDRWLKIDLMPPGQLSGQREERRTLRIWSRDSGIRAAVFHVNAGQGTQDLGFRSDVLITFDVTPSDSQPSG